MCAAKARKYVDGEPGFHFVGEVIAYKIGEDEYCMSVPTFRLWVRRANQILDDIAERGPAPIPITRGRRGKP